MRRRRFPVAGEPELDERTKEVMGQRNRRWHLLGSVLVPAVQAVIFAIGLRQLSRLVDRPWLFTGARSAGWPSSSCYRRSDPAPPD